jgi:hypothetical protein
MALVGYARVSSVGQSLDVQLDKLGHCDKVFQEKKVARRANARDSTTAWNKTTEAALARHGVGATPKDLIVVHTYGCPTCRPPAHTENTQENPGIPWPSPPCHPLDTSWTSTMCPPCSEVSSFSRPLGAHHSLL